MPKPSARSMEMMGIVRHRGRFSQIRIYLGKFFRMFVNQNDWKVLPMAAVISSLVGLVCQPNMFRTMEGTLFGAFALTCVSIWNGCFNSIQVICRERGIIKREHRSGMHISSYILAHMIYQAFLCLVQTLLLIFICYRIGVHFPEKGFITSWFALDFGITVFLITYASDMLGLFISSIVHSTTTAMTIMPFVLIFQLIFSGGFFASLPEWTQPLKDATISRYGLRSIAALGDYNGLPAVTAWNTLVKMADTEVGTTLTVDDVKHVLQNDAVRAQLRAVENGGFTMEDVADSILASGMLDEFEGDSYDLRIRILDVINAIGEDRMRDYILDATREASYNEDYVHTWENVAACWIILGLFTMGFAALSTVSLEFIDKDKR